MSKKLPPPSHQLPPDELDECIRLLRTSTMFRYCKEANLQMVAPYFKAEYKNQGDILIGQGEPTEKMFLVPNGRAFKYHTDEKQVKHSVPTLGTSYGSLHVLRKDLAYSSVEVIEDNTRIFTIDSNTLGRLLHENSDLADDIVWGLGKEIRHQTKLHRTPLLEQKSKYTTLPLVANSIAAGIESFYRSALNAMLNQKLAGTKTTLFPNMHIQIPTRIVYINGFKLLRKTFEDNVEPQRYSNPKLVRLGLAFAPGVIMTPISSLLEANNAGHKNPEPLQTRWMRGLPPRMVREVIFGLGLNQLTDWCEERISDDTVRSPYLRNMMGSLMAGVISGYLSHVPHNLSAMKLMEPQTSYSEHFSRFSQYWVERLPTEMPLSARKAAGGVLAVVFPRGVTIRTTQIVGSFIIINGIISAASGISRK